jgi:general secretion pathway protein G
MKLRHHAERRPGFTLVEMLVVLAIVVVLMSLIAGAVLYFTRVGPIIQAQTEISQLHHAVESFKQKYGIYPPSKIFLANNLQDYLAAYQYYSNLNDTYNVAVINNSWPVTSNSMQYLQRIFPKMALPPGPPANMGQVTQLTVDWTGQFDTSLLASNPNRWKGTFLEGDQCLVFFLGGMQTLSQPGNIPTCNGFASFAKNPTWMGNVANNYPPLYDFPSTRLTTVTRNYPKQFNVNPFFAYKDPYGTGSPYIYYSSYGTPNGYLSPDCLSQVGPTSLQSMSSPYYEVVSPIRQYLNKNTFQIISAGADGDFGAGGLWNPGVQPVDPFTKDNQSNFNSGGLMGTRS